MTHSLSDGRVAFHLSLNVSNIDRSVEFFRRVFGMSPTKHRTDYAKFELDNPPLTFSLEPADPGERGALNHVGFKFQSARELVELQRRLEAAGLRSEREAGVECCYSRQTKFWLHDPDGTLWEMYLLEGDLEHRGAGQSVEAIKGESPPTPTPLACASTPPAKEGSHWAHRLGEPLTFPESLAPASLDEISLQGSLNGPGNASLRSTFLTEAAARLKPGGKLAVHCLTADRILNVLPPLPGPASVVSVVPCIEELMSQLEQAGFQAIRLVKYGSNACFSVGEAELRETRIEAMNRIPVGEEMLTVVYKGPFAELCLEPGILLKRGRLTRVPRDVVENVIGSADRETLTIIEKATMPVSCGA